MVIRIEIENAFRMGQAFVFDDRREELLKLLASDPSISVLVLGAGTGPEGPGPLISALTSRYINALRVPLAIVPGNLTDKDIDAVT